MSTEHDGNLVIDKIHDRFERFRILRGNDESTDSILEEIGAKGRREEIIVQELTFRDPLAFPDRFQESHRLLFRAVEVLDRNGFRSPALPNLGPLGFFASWAVEQVTRIIVRSYQETIVDSARNLYARREARCKREDPQRRILALARIDADRLAPAYKGSLLGFPTFIIAALIPLIAAAFQGLGPHLLERGFIIGAAIFSFLVFGALAWIMLRAAAIAHRRIELTVEQPLAALWETIGGCGEPPTDDARTIAFVAIVLTALGWLVIPVVIGVVAGGLVG